MSEWCDYCRDMTDWGWDSGPYGWCNRCHHGDDGKVAREAEELAGVLRLAVSAMESVLRWCEMEQNADYLYSTAPGNKWDIPQAVAEAKAVLMRVSSRSEERAT